MDTTAVVDFLADPANRLGWGFDSFSALIPTTHHNITPVIDGNNVKLPKLFTVAIVGASRGIGAGIALQYAKAGASGLVLASRRISGLEETAAACKKVNPNVQIEIIACDITSASSVSELADKTKAKFERLEVVVVNSGYSGPVELKLTDTDPETFQQASNVNYVGTFHVAKYFIPLLLATKDGAKAFIAVNTVGSLIIKGPIANAQYAVSKMAQLRLMEYVHEQYFDEGISAYSVHPGAVDTEMAATAPEHFKAFLVDSVELCGGYCVWLTKEAEKKRWLSGRLISATWDADLLDSKKDAIVSGNLLKFTMDA